jgi:hypothetical protein
VKPAVGFTLPSAGVTPAPNVKRKMRDFVPVKISLVPYLHGERSGIFASPLRGEADARPHAAGEGHNFSEILDVRTHRCDGIVRFALE